MEPGVPGSASSLNGSSTRAVNAAGLDQLGAMAERAVAEILARPDPDSALAAVLARYAETPGRSRGLMRHLARLLDGTADRGGRTPVDDAALIAEVAQKRARGFTRKGALAAVAARAAAASGARAESVCRRLGRKIP